MRTSTAIRGDWLTVVAQVEAARVTVEEAPLRTEEKFQKDLEERGLISKPYRSDPPPHPAQESPAPPAHVEEEVNVHESNDEILAAHYACIENTKDNDTHNFMMSSNMDTK